MKLSLASVAVLLVVSQAHAEYRTVLLQIKPARDHKVAVAIHSDETKEQKSAVSIEGAVNIIGEMKGWGSQVGVYITIERTPPSAELKKLLATVIDNPWLELKYVGPEVPRAVADHFLKGGQAPPRSPQTPGQLKDALVGRWVSDDADKLPVQFQSDGSMRLALYRWDSTWKMAEGTYGVADDGRVKFTAKLGGLTVHGQFTMKEGVLIGPSGSSPETRWKKLPETDRPGADSPAAAERDPEEAFRGACDRLAALEGKHLLLQGVSRVKPAIQRDDQKRLQSAVVFFENNAVAPTKHSARAKDESRPFCYVSVQVWSGRTQSPPANLYDFPWQGRTYQIWVRVFASDADLVRLVRKAIEEPLIGPRLAPGQR
jgi:hypothetical protein